jgi:hypothetical protein
VSDDVIIDLKSHARVLHRRALERDPAALQRLRKLPEFARKTDEDIARALQRKHCLAAAARALGFASWLHLCAVLSDREQDDFGTLLYPTTCHGYYNIWSASYDDAHEIRAAHGGYLLAYKRQFLIVDPPFIESMGLDPEDPDWERMARDWPRPRDPEARRRLYRQLIHNALIALTLQEGATCD